MLMLFIKGIRAFICIDRENIWYIYHIKISTQSMGNGWMTYHFTSFLTNITVISVISGRLMGDNERLCAVEPY